MLPEKDMFELLRLIKYQLGSKIEFYQLSNGLIATECTKDLYNQL